MSLRLPPDVESRVWAFAYGIKNLGFEAPEFLEGFSCATDILSLTAACKHFLTRLQVFRCVQLKLDGQLYIVGGPCDRYEPSPIDRFDPRTGSWKVLPPMPTSRSGPFTCTLAGQLYVCLGYNDASPGHSFDSIECFDPGTGAWRALPPMHRPRNEYAAAALGGRLYAAGGWSPPILDSVERFDPGTGSWYEMPPMLFKRQDPSAFVFGGMLYIFGSWDEEVLEEELEDVDSIQCFDPGTSSWQMLPPMPTGRTDYTVSVLGGQLYVIGGFDEDGYLDSVERFNPDTRSWQVLPPIPTKRFDYSASVLGGRLYIVGGRCEVGVHGWDTLRCVERFDPGTDSWQVLPPISTSRVHHSASALAGQLYVVGGWNAPSSTGWLKRCDGLDSVERFNPATCSWEVFPAMSMGRAHHSACVIAGHL